VVEAVTPGYVVELFGLPGSGKSYLTKELLRISADIGLPMNLPVERVGPAVPSLPRRARKLGLAAGQVLQRPVPSFTTMRSIVMNQRPHTEGLGRCVQWAITQRLLTSAGRSPGVHLFDEGLLQSLWSVGLRGDVTPMLRSLEQRSGRYAMPDLVVTVHASIDEIEDRLAARLSRHSRLQEHMDPIVRRRELGRGAELVGSLVAWWEHIAPGPGRLIEIRNDPGRDLHAEAVALLDMIASRAHLASRPVA
jgi:hypothetical protein